MQNAKSRLVLVVLWLVGAFAVSSLRADDLPRPTGDVILSVTGNISRTNAPMRADFDRGMLLALGEQSFTTSHSWADKPTTFTGVPVARLLDAVGAQGTKIRAGAVNSYSVELDVAELRRYPVLLAMKADGVELQLRDRGPLWIVYPRDSFRELRDESNNFKWIWQLRSLELR
ncbi:MAG: oxidoreductase [Bosea sp.]|jgi:hypothetical protein|nr:oxidoreductase [Bosea sp. (in: a-proteobacteria)]